MPSGIYKRSKKHCRNISKSKKGKKRIFRETRTCACGCNRTFECKVNSAQKFIHGHNNKGKKIIFKNPELRKKRCRSAKIGIVWKKEDIKKRGKAIKKAWEDRNNNGFKVMGVKVSKSKKGKKFSMLHRKNLRLAAIKRIKNHYGVSCPNFNLQACKFFKSFDKRNNTQGRYTMYGNGEYFIKELGYWPDYINFNKKLIIEYDEKHHYDKNGNLKEKDLIRQKEIQEHFPDFKFKRI